MKLIFLGPPGAGKGTLAIKVMDMFKLPHIGTGAIFRSAIAAKTPLGVKIKAIIDAGQLVDDETTVALVKERLAEDDVQNGYLLDGFPRTILQADALAEFSFVDKVINFQVPDSLVLERLSGRLVCRGCGYNFHKTYDKPKKEGVCDYCGGEIYTRPDDNPVSIQKRIEVYQEQTAPLIDYYREKQLLFDLDARPTADKVMENLIRGLGMIISGV